MANSRSPRHGTPARVRWFNDIRLADVYAATGTDDLLQEIAQAHAQLEAEYDSGLTVQAGIFTNGADLGLHPV